MEYNRFKAVEYAKTWALSHNPAFFHYGGIGGDCTNFVSQCLLAGGANMIFGELGWFYRSANQHSASWTSVKYLQDFLLKEKNKGVFATIVPLENLKLGDLIQLRQNPTHFNHTVIVSKIEDSQIFVCAHSNDALDKPLNRYSYEQTLGLHIQLK